MSFEDVIRNKLSEQKPNQVEPALKISLKNTGEQSLTETLESYGASLRALFELRVQLSSC